MATRGTPLNLKGEAFQRWCWAQSETECNTTGWYHIIKKAGTHKIRTSVLEGGNKMGVREAPLLSIHVTPTFSPTRFQNWSQMPLQSEFWIHDCKVWCNCSVSFRYDVLLIWFIYDVCPLKNSMLHIIHGAHGCLWLSTLLWQSLFVTRLEKRFAITQTCDKRCVWHWSKMFELVNGARPLEKRYKSI